MGLCGTIRVKSEPPAEVAPEVDCAMQLGPAPGPGKQLKSVTLWVTPCTADGIQSHDDEGVALWDL